MTGVPFGRGCILACGAITVALASSASAELSVFVDFAPAVGEVGETITFSVITSNLTGQVAAVHVDLSLTSGGTVYTKPRVLSMEDGEEQCADVTITPSSPGAITIRLEASVDGESAFDSAELFVVPGGEASPVDDIPTFAEFVLDSLAPCEASPVGSSSWGRMKALYR